MESHANLTVTAPLDVATRGLLAFAGRIAVGGDALLAEGVARLSEAGTPEGWVDELILQSVLMVGWPRALIASGAWRAAHGPPGGGGVVPGSMDLAEWTRRGEETCRIIYGANYDKLRRNVRALHPALDAWMVSEGYGRTLSRPGLDLARRELCTVVQMAILDAPRQLHSHLCGALNAGAAPAAVDEALAVGLEFAAPHRAAALREVWRGIRPT